MSFDENKQNGQPDVVGNPAEETPAQKAEIVFEFGTVEEAAAEKPEEDDRFSAFAQPVVQQKEKKQRRISKRTSTLIFTSLGALVLAVAVLVVTLFPFADGPAVSGSTSSGGDFVDVTPTYPLLDKTLEDEDAVVVKQADVTYDGGNYSIVYNEKDKIYQLKGYEDLTLDTDGTESLVEALSSVTASGKVESAENLADFGLDKPAATVTGTYHDASTATLYVGNETPSGEGYYVSVKDKDGVYICAADAVSPFLATGTMYVETTLISAPKVDSDDANGAPALREVTLSGKTHPTPLTIRRRVDSDKDALSFYTYIITKPYLRGASTEATNELSAFTSLTANQAVVLHPTAAEKKKMGFDDPLTTMKITLCVVTTSAEENTASSDTSSTETEEVTRYYNTIKSTVTIGSKDESGDYLVMVDGINAIFLVNASSLSTIAERSYDNTVTELLFLKDITELKQVNITIGGVKHELSLTHYPDEEDRDKMMVVKEGDKTYTTPDFRTLYQLMMGLARYQPLDKMPTGEAELELSIIDQNGQVFLSAKFYAAGASLYHVVTSEGEQFTVKASSINHFVKQINNLFEGKTVLVETF